MSVPAVSHRPGPPHGAVPVPSEAPGAPQLRFADFLGGSPDGGAPREPRSDSKADPFNENGWFGHVAGTSALPTTQPAHQAPDIPGAGSAAAMLPPPQGEDALVQAPDAEPERCPLVVSRDGRAAAAAGLEDGLPQGGSDPVAHAGGQARSSSAPVEPYRTARAGSRRTAEAAGSARHDRRPAANAANSRLTLHSGADGVSLVARAERLSREEQLRLKTAIVALLARHGLVARRIVLNGEAQPALGTRGE